MKIRLTILLFSIYFVAQGQKLIDSYFNAILNQGDSIKYYFNDWGFCGPGPIISEEIFFLTNQKFVYFSHVLPCGSFLATGKYSQSRKYLHLDYQKIEIDSIKTANCFSDSNKFQLKTAFKIVKDKHWEDDDILNLIECGRNMSKIRLFLVYGKNLDHTHNFFLYRKKRLVLMKSTTYDVWKENACR